MSWRNRTKLHRRSWSGVGWLRVCIVKWCRERRKEVESRPRIATQPNESTSNRAKMRISFAVFQGRPVRFSWLSLCIVLPFLSLSNVLPFGCNDFFGQGSRNMCATKAPTPDDVLTAQDEATPPFVVTSWLASSVYSEVMPRKKKGSWELTKDRHTAKRVNKQRSKDVDIFCCVSRQGQSVFLDWVPEFIQCIIVYPLYYRLSNVLSFIHCITVYPLYYRLSSITVIVLPLLY